MPRASDRGMYAVLPKKLLLGVDVLKMSVPFLLEKLVTIMINSVSRPGSRVLCSDYRFVERSFGDTKVPC